MFKTKIQNVLKPLVHQDSIWLVLQPFSKLGKFFLEKRQEFEDSKNTISKQERIMNELPFEIGELLLKKEVLNGPFKGLKYKHLDSVLSTIYPKILGSYEMELHDIFRSWSERPYEYIIDIGCAEGYYAIGLALNYPNAKIIAYDINERARNLCADMAALNEVSEMIVIKDFCSSEELKNFQFSGRSLIICDCEGCEKELFTKENMNNLKGCDIIVEVHDFIDIEILEKLIELITPTHSIKRIFSTDDIEKAKTYSFKETNKLPLKTKYQLFREGRPTRMEWLICEPINSIS